MSDEEYRAVKRILKDNVGTIVRFPENGEKRVRFSPHNAPDEHPTVVEAALWVRSDRPKGSSKYKTFISRSLDSSRGRSTVNDGAYAEDYVEAFEWLEDTSEEYVDERISWLDLPKMVITQDELEERIDESA